MSKNQKTQKEKEEEKTDFQGPVSLDAIFAATSKSKEVIKEEPKKTVIESKTEPVVEEPVEPVKEEVTTEPIKEEPVQPPVTEPIQPNADEETNAFKTAQQLIKLGVLEDFVIQTSEEDENGTSISEFKTMTDENLEEIIKIHQQEKTNEISSNYISKEGLKEHQLKV